MPDTQKTLAAMALALNNPPCEQHPTVGVTGDEEAGFLILELDQATSESADEGLKQGMFMLLALTLDLWRRNEYAFAALNAALGPADFDAVDPAYAARISLHNQGLHSYENPKVGQTDWRSRAVMADEIVHRMLHFTEAPHRRYLQAATAKANLLTVLAEECGHLSELTRIVSGDMHAHGGDASQS